MNNKSREELRLSMLKPRDTIFKKLFYRKISTRLTVLVINTPLTPNILSFSGIIIGFLTAFFFSFGNYWYSLLSVLLYNLYFIIDCMDGELARTKNITTPLGALLDNFSDRFVEGCIFAGLSVGAYLALKDPIYLIFGILSILHYYLFSFASEIAYSGKLSRVPKIKISDNMYFSSHSVIIASIIFAAVFNITGFMIKSIALFGWIFWVYQLFRIYHFSRKA